MRKLFAIFCLIILSVLAVVFAGEKRIVGARVNNQLLLLRVDMANYQMDCSVDGTTWSAVSAMSEIADNALSLSKLAQVPTASILGNVTGSTANVTALSASDLKTLIGNATTSVSGLMSAADKTTLGSRAASGANSDITSLTGLTTALPVAQGGTGAGTAAGARSSLGAAASGANSDITSLTGLTTALSIAQGGTGAATAAGARSSLGAAASGANSDITSLTGLTTALSIAQGGTGAGTAAGARSSLGTAASGANSDITSLTGLTTALSITQGGTGLSALGTAGQVPTVNAGATALEWVTPSTDSVSSVSDLTDVSLSGLATGDGLVYEAGTGTVMSLSHFNDSASDEVGGASWSVMSGLDSPTYAAGKFGNAAVFNGNCGIYHSSIEHLYNRSTFTMEAWFYPTTFTDGHILGVYEEISVTLLSSHHLGIWVHNGSAEVQVGSTGATTLSANTWNHIRLVRNANDFYLYLNGVLECSGTSSVRSTAPETGRKLTIGALGVGVEGYNHYTGRVDEFRLLNEALIGDFTPATAPYTVPSGIWRNQKGVIQLNAQTGTGYTLVIADQGKLVTMSNASANTLTIPLNSSVAFPVGAWIDVSDVGAGTCTITAASGVTLNGTDGGTKDLAQWAGTRLYKIDTNTWITR